MRRTIADARNLLDTSAKELNPEAFRQYDREVKAAEAAIKTRAVAHVQAVYDDHVQVARSVSEELCTVRDAARRLTEQINTGRITPSEAAAELERLRSASRSQRSGHDRLAQVADRMDAVESDPAAWHAGLAAKFPHMLTNFSF